MHVLLTHLVISILGKLVEEMSFIFTYSKMDLWQVEKSQTLLLFPFTLY